jgi:hypothetical protein
MFGNRTRIRSALVAGAVLALALSGGATAFAASPAAPAAAQQGAVQQTDDYSLVLSPATATVRPGGTTVVRVSFRSEAYLLGVPADLTVAGAPAGVSATVLPSTVRIGGTAVLVLTAARSAPARSAALTVTAITDGTDPIGTTTSLGVTVG